MEKGSSTAEVKKEPLQISTPTVDNNVMYLAQSTEDLSAAISKPCVFSDTRLVESITLGQAATSSVTP